MKQLIVISLLIASVNCLIAFDCSNNNPVIKTLSLVNTPTCSLKERNITTKNIFIQLIQPKTFDTIKYSQCLIEITHLIYRCGKTFDNFHQDGLLTEVPIINKIECDQMIKQGYYYYKGLKLEFDQSYNINRFTVGTFGSISDGYCTPGDYDKPLIMNGKQYNRAVRISNFKIMIKQGLGSVDLDDKKIIFENGVKCDFERLTCFSALDGYSFWDNYFHNPLCSSTKEYLPIFEGPATQVTEMNKGKELRSIIIHYDDYDYQIQLTDKTSRICNQIAYISEHPKLAVIESNGNIGFELKFDKEKLGKNINIMTYFNSKLVFTLRHTKEQIDDLYKRISFDRCLAEEKIIQNLITTARANPLEFAYEYMDGPGYTATVRGEIVYISKCKAVSVNFTSIPSKCFNELPVQFNDKNMFMTPRNHLLIDSGTEIDCSTILQVGYNLENHWFGLNLGTIFNIKEPSTIQINKDKTNEDWEFKMIDHLVEAGIYSQDDLDKVQKIIMTPIQISALTTHLYRGLKGEGQLPEGNSVVNLLSDGDSSKMIEKTLGGFLSSTYSWITTFGNWVAFLIGIVAVIRTIKFILNIFLNTKEIISVFGLSWRILFCWWDSLCHHMLRNAKKKSETKTSPEVINDSEIPLKNKQYMSA